MKPLLIIAALLMIGCGSSPAAPTKTGSSVSGVALAATSVAVGSTDQGTVTLVTAASPGGASVALSSSNPLVATVQTPVTILAGASSITFTITAVAAGTATITAVVDGSSGQSPMFTVTARPALSAIALSASTVLGGAAVTGTAILTATAPAGGAVVSLSGGDPVSMPASVTVGAGSTSATFNITTRPVSSATDVTISGSYAGASASAVLSVTPSTVAVASFGVSGPFITETCDMADGGATLNCTFNGSTSTAPGTIVAWDWSWSTNPASIFALTTTGPVLTMPAVNCSLLPAPPLPPGSSWFTMRVNLRIRDDLGNTATATNGQVRLMPQGTCGF
jgi:trimeric autotransporter adhesin